MCSFEGTILLLKDRGLVKWYDRGLQNLWWEFDSLIPCSKPLKMKAFARLRLQGNHRSNQRNII